MAISAVAAIAGAIGTVEVGATIVAAVGLGMTAVGAITGNKNLMKFGSVMGLAAGVTGAITGAASAAEAGASAATSTAGEVAAETAANTAADTAAQVGADTAASTASSAATSALPSDIAQSVTPFEDGFQGTSAIQDAMNTNGNLAGTRATDAFATNSNLSAAAQNGGSNLDVMTPADAGTVTPGTPTGANAPSTPVDNTILDPWDARVAGRGAIPSLVNNPMPASDFWSNVNAVGDWMEKHKMMSWAMMNVGSGVVNGIYQSNIADKQYDLQNRALAMNERSRQYASGMVTPSGAIIRTARG